MAGGMRTRSATSPPRRDALVVYAPGEPMEGFAHAAAELSSMDEVLALAERHGITMLGPLP